MQFDELIDEIAGADPALDREATIRTIHLLGEVLCDALRRREQVSVEGIGTFSPTGKGMVVLNL